MEEDFQHIGERLRKAREALDLSIEDVSHRAHLPRSVVEALEAENFKVFTSPTYAKSFLAQYGNFLEVDATPWLEALEPAYFISGEMVRPLIALEGSPSVEPGTPDNGRASIFSALWVLTVSAALIMAAIWGYRLLEDKFATEPAGDEGQVEIAGTPAAPAPKPPSPPAAEETPPREEPVAKPQPVPAPRAIIVGD